MNQIGGAKGYESVLFTLLLSQNPPILGGPLAPSAPPVPTPLITLHSHKRKVNVH